LRQFGHALVAQLDRASDFESEGREFESLRARQFGIEPGTLKLAVFAREVSTTVSDPRQRQEFGSVGMAIFRRGMGSAPTAWRRARREAGVFVCALLMLTAMTAISPPGTSAEVGGAIRFMHPPEDPLGLVRSPLSFFVAAGAPDACGKGCSSWIAAEGYFDGKAPRRFEAFLERVNGYNLPVFFNSPGGYLSSAEAIGRLMRKRGMTAGVGRTVPQDCEPNAADGKSGSAPDIRADADRHADGGTISCEALARLGQVASQLHSFATCSSGCVIALFGGTVRLVPPGARLGVHSPPRLRQLPNGMIELVPGDAATGLVPSDPAAITEMRSYVQEMGIAPGIMDLTATIPYEQMRWLSRDEIAAFAIDVRTFEETSWEMRLTPPPSIVKAIQEVKAPQYIQRRLRFLRLTCAKPSLVHVQYYREPGSNEGTAPQGIALASEHQQLVLTGPPTRTKSVWPELGSLDVYEADMAAGSLEAVAADANVDILESETLDWTSARRTSLSTAGLAQAIKSLRGHCGDASR
jgi:hypothetical protein